MIKEFTTAVTALFKGLDDPNYKKDFLYGIPVKTTISNFPQKVNK